MFECLCAHIIRFILSYMSGVQSVYNKFLDHTRKTTQPEDTFSIVIFNAEGGLVASWSIVVQVRVIIRVSQG